MPQRPRVTVLGSLNTDISLPVPHLPVPGETVLSGGSAVLGAGGKGANQAVAAARLGAVARMAGCCGGDDFGARLRATLAAEGVDVSGVRVIPGVSSGLALITVDEAGENAIAVAQGANGRAGEPEVVAALAAPCDVLVLSAEVPALTLEAALREARRRGVPTVLNVAPVPASPGGLLAAGPDWLVVNEHEAGELLEDQVTGMAAAQSAAVRLAGRGHAVVTVGASGAALAGPGLVGTAGTGLAGTEPAGTELAGTELAGTELAGTRQAGGGSGPGGAAAVPGFAVRSVDSVGAGDAFVGALAVALASGVDPAGAVKAACAAGAAATTRRGAQDGLPRPADVLAATGFRWPGPS